MTILDRYVVRQFLLTFLFALVAFLLIFLVVDLMEKLDDFVDAKVDAHIILIYYAYFMPEIIRLMIPVGMLMGALFVTGRMASQNELAAMKSSGVSLTRILLPFLSVAALVSLASIYFNGWVVPKANQGKFDIERRYLQKHMDATGRFDIYFQEGRTRIVSLGYYYSDTRSASRVSIEEFSDTNLTVLTRRYDARQMKWVDAGDTVRFLGSPEWVLLDGTIREFSGQKESLTAFAEIPMGRLALTPEDIEKKQRQPDEMPLEELGEFIINQQRAGQDVSRWLVDYHAKIAFPFASVIVVLFGVPFSSHKRRGGVALQFGISVAITFTYLIFSKTSQVFGYNGDLNPLLTAWLANLLFFAAGLVNLIRIQK
jgi:lipopolysaccharide export system permease protein